MGDLIALLISAILLIIAYFTGSIIEKKHFENIRAREIKLMKLPHTSIGKRLISNKKPVKKVKLVTGCAVIASDHFKEFVSGFKTFFGGRMTSYESIIDRARREAILRMRESAVDSSIIINMKLETTILSDSLQKQPAQVAVMAYGTAITYE